MLQIASEILRNLEDNTEVRYSVSLSSILARRALGCVSAALLAAWPSQLD